MQEICHVMQEMLQGIFQQHTFTNLDEFFKPKQNTMMAIKEVWTNFQQGNEELNSWIARISNAVQLANYAESTME